MALSVQPTIIIIIIISAHKSDLSSPWSQTQASLSIPSLHTKKQIKEEKERKNNRRESLPRSDRRGGEKINQEQKQKQRPAKHIRETNKKASKTDQVSRPHDCRYRTRVAKHTLPVTGGSSGQSSVETRGYQYSNNALLVCGIQIDIMGAQTANGKAAKSSFAWRALASFTRW